MEIDYGKAPVDDLPGKNRSGGRAPKGKPHSSMFEASKNGGVVPPVAQSAFVEVDDGIQRKKTHMGGTPKPLRRR